MAGVGEGDTPGVRLLPGVSIAHPVTRRHPITMIREKKTLLFIGFTMMALRQVILML
jgi:hypothetical protein